MPTQTTHANHLINEKSPYLLQHAHNPVDWFPWGEEAFRKAKSEDKPVFLSIGYSTCHWCHVMAHESFEDEEVARVMNRDFIAVKVDREERPDIDAVYMSVCQALTGSGGWPLTIVMTPDQKPFYAGTYLPKSSRYSMPGLIDLLEGVAEKWRSNRESLLRSGNKIARAFSSGPEQEKNARPTKEIIADAYSHFSQSFDRVYGGFGRSPKFPTPHNLMFLLRYSVMEQDAGALAMVEKTLRQMYRGGIFDHIGFGFSRYSTDAEWLIPHFEKMLYDNALLAMAYLETYQVTGREFYRCVAEKTFRYILREMTDENGGFYSAQDADSEGEEGGYYVFTPEETTRLLGEEDGNAFNSFYGITGQGNFEGKSIPNLLENEEYDKPNERMERLLPKLYQYRLTRARLHKDDKILTSWNALMISALAKAYRILGDGEYLKAARKAMRFLWENLSDGAGGLFVRWRDGEAAGKGNLDDYSFTVWALLELYEADFCASDLEKALQLCQKILSDFLDEETGGFYLTEKGAEQLIFRPKETYDGAVPSGNSVAGYCLQRLAGLTGRADLEEAASRQMEFLTGAAKPYPAGYSFAMIALTGALYPATEVVAVLNEKDGKKALCEMMRRKFLPNTVFLVMDEDNREKIIKTAEFAKDYPFREGRSAFYVCRNRACSEPVSTLSELESALS